MRYGWLTSKSRKRHQRAMNSIMRQINHNVEKDELWKGRFYVRQIASHWYQYEDKSGAELWVVLRFYDKKTGIVKTVAETVNHWRYFNGSHMWWEMNNFIVNTVNVWQEDIQPGSQEWFKNMDW